MGERRSGGKGPMRRGAFLCGVLLAGVLAGCAPSNGKPSPAATVEPIDPYAPSPGQAPSTSALGSQLLESRTGQATRPATGEILAIRVKFTILELPAGAAAEDARLWEGAEADPIGPIDADTLRRNGLHASVVGADSLNDLTDRLRELSGKVVASGMLIAPPDAPGSVTLKHDPSPRMIFTVQPDGSASGEDYPAGDYLLTLRGRLAEEDPTRILLTVVPQIRSTATEVAPAPAPRGMGFQIQREVLSFDQAAFSLPVPAGGVLMIGPIVPSRRSGSIGGCFLTGNRAGAPFDTVILLIPETLEPSL